MAVYDLIIIGGGPAGISAALTAHRRALSTLILSLPMKDSPLAKAGTIENYPGFPSISGKQLLERMEQQLQAIGIPQETVRVSRILPSGGLFYISAGEQLYTCRSILLATGKTVSRPIPGEEEYLGRGVSYCATCDGMLYRGKKVCVVGMAKDAPSEADFLSSVGCAVTFFCLPGAEDTAPHSFPTVNASRFAIQGNGETVTALEADGAGYPADGIFLLRNTPTASALFPELALTAGGSIQTDRGMRTSIPGVFAAGDCTGEPLQIAKAVGEGNIAVLSAFTYLKEQSS